MPVLIPLAGAALGAMAAGAALAAGATVVAGLMYAGAAATAIGALTGNKDLTKLGAVLGLAGGVGGLATGAFSGASAVAAEAAPEATVASTSGATDVATNVASNVNTAADAASTAVEAAKNSSALASGADTGASLAGSGAGAASGGGSAASPLADSAGSSLANQGSSLAGSQPGLIDQALNNTPGLDGSITTQSAFNSTPAQQNLFGAQPNNLAGADMASSGASAPGADMAASATPSATGSTTDYSLLGNSNAATNATSGSSTFNGLKIPGSSPSTLNAMKADPTWYSKLADVVNNNQGLAMLGTGLVSGAAQGYLGQKSAEDQFNRQKDYQNWLRQRYNDSLRNLTIPSLVLNKNGSNGIINGARG